MKQVKRLLLSVMRSVNRKLFSTNWLDLRSVTPVSEYFGIDRGLPVDRYYIGKFLNNNKNLIKGIVLEIGDDFYSKLYGKGITTQEILHFTSGNPVATLTGDLTKTETLKPEIADCFICTQTLNFIYNVKEAIQGIYYLLKNNGTALVTIAGISQISSYDMERWGDYWRFTDKSAQKIFSDVFGEQNVEVQTYGNVLSSVSFLEGISSEELMENELLYNDKNYQLVIAVKAIKKNI
ncbi:MAG: hypothetical protein JXJ22_13750 [Bacteroidales bacterium]|nr:hypothetical protein [Bacteroidales bacterium]